MIDIAYDKDKAITITGHAGYAPKGQDIVCAAVSTAYHVLTALPGIGYCDKDDKCKAWAIIDDESVRTWINTIADVLKRIALSYPDHIRYVECSIVPETDCLYFTN